MTEPIKSPQNEKLTLARKLRQRKHREREGLFVGEGEDLLEAALAAGREPVELLTAAGSGLGGNEVEPGLLDSVSALGSGTRAIGIWPIEEASAADLHGGICVYLHGLGDPANVGAIVRSARALVEGTVVLGPGSADPHSPKAVRAAMGALFSQPVAKAGIEQTPEPRVGLVAHDGEPPERLAKLSGPVTLCLGAERGGLPDPVVDLCKTLVTIPLRPGAESLNVAAAAAIALHGISSPATGADDV
jgi:TrmH family RNA methyltransferase